MIQEMYRGTWNSTADLPNMYVARNSSAPVIGADNWGIIGLGHGTVPRGRQEQKRAGERKKRLASLYLYYTHMHAVMQPTTKTLRLISVVGNALLSSPSSSLPLFSSDKVTWLMEREQADHFFCHVDGWLNSIPQRVDHALEKSHIISYVSRNTAKPLACSPDNSDLRFSDCINLCVSVHKETTSAVILDGWGGSF